ncbi:hypothetical protein FQA47_003538 [Oryzias melastigma]|uniref:Uncharacterized protein n=1 Tax=Oryzias melastigma TaxID=30732 RepID=A0A834CAG4_ORYME|nr:hypothetical protein FQA47_003538 [Oryzias melastigma]
MCACMSTYSRRRRVLHQMRFFPSGRRCRPVRRITGVRDGNRIGTGFRCTFGWGGGGGGATGVFTFPVTRRLALISSHLPVLGSSFGPLLCSPLIRPARRDPRISPGVQAGGAGGAPAAGPITERHVTAASGARARTERSRLTSSGWTFPPADPGGSIPAGGASVTRRGLHLRSAASPLREAPPAREENRLSSSMGTHAHASLIGPSCAPYQAVTSDNRERVGWLVNWGHGVLEGVQRRAEFLLPSQRGTLPTASTGLGVHPEMNLHCRGRTSSDPAVTLGGQESEQPSCHPAVTKRVPVKHGIIMKEEPGPPSPDGWRSPGYLYLSDRWNRRTRLYLVVSSTVPPVPVFLDLSGPVKTETFCYPPQPPVHNSNLGVPTEPPPPVEEGKRSRSRTC